MSVEGENPEEKMLDGDRLAGCGFGLAVILGFWVGAGGLLALGLATCT